MNDIRLNIADVDFAQDEETREAKHELLASFLGAFADNELPPETRSQIDAHLTGCARCRRELDVHRVLRTRLGNEPVPGASSALRDRIAAGIRSAPPPVFAPGPAVDASQTVRRPRSFSGWRSASAFVLVALSVLVAVPVWRAQQSDNAPAIVEAKSVPLFAEVLANYRLVTAGNLPGRARDLEAVRAAVPFEVTPIANNSLRLLGAWTTSIGNEPAAVLQYRWNDRIVLQYFVSDELLFQSAGVRASLAQHGSASTADGEQGVLMWAEPEYGTLLVGEFSPDKLATLRDSNRKH